MQFLPTPFAFGAPEFNLGIWCQKTRVPRLRASIICLLFWIPACDGQVD